MTGQKDRYSTTEKLWNLDDKQLTTPKHDELVLMLLDKEYIRKKIVRDNLKSEVLNISIEKPLVNNNGFYVGYIDVCIEVELSIPRVEVRCPYCNKLPFSGTLNDANKAISISRELECNICNKKFKIKEDLLVPYEDDKKQLTYYIECKPKITSFGE